MRIFDIKYLLLLLLLSMGIVACDETDETGEFDNWVARNEAYIDSIAKVARTNADGSWKSFLAYGLADTIKWNNNYYVYCQVLESGDGDENPKFNDIVKVNYRGRLIPTMSYPDGYVFDESYSGELDPDVHVAVELSLAGCVRGWTTAMCEMVQGDVWRIFVPYELGYGKNGSGAIPGYSTLVFDINLVDFSNVGASVH